MPLKSKVRVASVFALNPCAKTLRTPSTFMLSSPLFVLSPPSYSLTWKPPHPDTEFATSIYNRPYLSDSSVSVPYTPFASSTFAVKYTYFCPVTGVVSFPPAGVTFTSSAEASICASFPAIVRFSMEKLVSFFSAFSFRLKLALNRSACTATAFVRS